MSGTKDTALPQEPPTMAAPVQLDSGFDTFLNYDIRRVMYDFMESELPPLSNAYAGFAMCCTAALEEIQQASVKARNNFAHVVEAEFLDKTTFECHVPRVLKNFPWSQLTSFVVETPLNLFLVSGCEEHKLAMHIFLIFYPLFLLPFDNVTIVFKDIPGFIGPRASPAKTSKVLNASLGVWALVELSAFINHSVYHISQGNDEIFWLPVHRTSVRATPGGLLGTVIAVSPKWYQYTNSTMVRADLPKAKRIAIGYDARAPADQGNEMQLTGVCCGQMLSSNSSEPEPCTKYYHMRSADALVGEHGFVNNHGWALSGPTEMENCIPCGMCRHHESRCSSDGFGHDLQIDSV
jgi:hypothetical protein